MALLLRNLDCPSCRDRHHFGYDGDRLEEGEYEYVCPRTGQAASLRLTEQPEGTSHWPQGAVPLQRKA